MTEYNYKVNTEKEVYARIKEISKKNIGKIIVFSVFVNKLCVEVYKTRSDISANSLTAEFTYSRMYKLIIIGVCS